MSFNTFGKQFRFTTWGESHGPAIGCVVDGCPPNINLKEQDIQVELDRRKPGQSKFTTQRKEDDKVQILSGVFEGKTTGTPISLIIYNQDMRSKDYGNIKDKFRPGHADFTYFKKYGIRDYRGGGRSSARETASRVAAGAIAKKVLENKLGKNFKVVGFDIDKNRIKPHKDIKFFNPFNFFDYCFLQKNAKFVISDSGSISEESVILNFPAINLRNSHERAEAMDSSAVIMTGINQTSVMQSINIMHNQNSIGSGFNVPPNV